MRTAPGVALIALGISSFFCCTLPSGALSWFWASGGSLVLFGGGSEGHVTRKAIERQESERPTKIASWRTAAGLTFFGGVALIGAGCYLVRQGRLARKKAEEEAAVEVRDLKARIAELESKAPGADES